MALVWSEERKLETWLQVEVAAAEALGGEELIPTEDLAAIRQARAPDPEAVRERERVTNHDVAAFVDVVSASLGDAGRWIHYGLTSSDVLDTALALQLREAGRELLTGADGLTAVLVRRAREFSDVLCMGRTHGVHAEPTTFGVKLAGFAWESRRGADRMRRAFAGAEVGKLSGAVGTYSTLGPDVEETALARLGLRREEVSTQVVPRDRHAEVLGAIALAGASLERLATEIRHLQRTEVREVEEPFGEGQKGSSAMPHKRNPIASERVTGLARLLRGYAQAGLENVALWHERDISHSSVERVALPDATTLLHYMQHVMTGVVDGMRVHPDRMRDNLELTHGALFSQAVLTALIESGLSRDAGYGLVQRNAQRAWDEQRSFRELLESDEEVASRLDAKRLDALFDYDRFVRHAPGIIERLRALD